MRAETALAEYEAARRRLPEAGTPGAGLGVSDLAELSDGFDVFLLDAFGVLNIGDEAIPGAPERVRDLLAADKRVLVLTNAASIGSAALVEKYARLGFDFASDDVVSSRDAMLRELRAEPDRHWGVMGRADRQGRDLDGVRLSYLDDDPAAFDRADAFLFLGSGAWSDALQGALESAIEERPRPVWVANPDIVAPRKDGFSVEPGHFAHRLADRTGVEPRFFGKPFRGVYDLAFERLGAGFQAARAVMVGDSLHTDILGAKNAGIASALITGFGFFSGQSARDAADMTGIVPDYFVSRP